MITQLKLDESAKLEFGVAITGASSLPDARFIIESTDFSIMIPCIHVSGGVEVKIPALKNIIPAGEYQARLEIILDSKIYTPLKESIVFNPSIEIESRRKPIAPAIKESVKVAKITVKRGGISEVNMRKTQAAMIIAQALNYLPESNENPEHIIENAMANVNQLTTEQQSALRDMLSLAESAGIIITTRVPDALVIVDESLIPIYRATRIPKKLITEMVSSLTSNDYLDAYTTNEFLVVDTKSGKILTEAKASLSAKSHADQLKDRVRLAKTSNKLAGLALYTRSSPEILQKKANHVAAIAVRKKLANKALDKLTSIEIAHLKDIITNRAVIVSQVAAAIIPIIRNIEETKLSCMSITK